MTPECEVCSSSGTERILPIPKFFDKALDVVWAACAASDLGVHFHFGQGLPKAIYPNATALRPRGLVAEVDFWCRRPLWNLVWGGALERYPGLKLVFTETKVDWIPAPSATWIGNGRRHRSRPLPPASQRVLARAVLRRGNQPFARGERHARLLHRGALYVRHRLPPLHEPLGGPQRVLAGNLRPDGCDRGRSSNDPRRGCRGPVSNRRGQVDAKLSTGSARAPRRYFVLRKGSTRKPSFRRTFDTASTVRPVWSDRGTQPNHFEALPHDKGERCQPR